MIARLDGHLVIDPATAELLARALDVLGTGQQGRRLTPELERVRAGLRGSGVVTGVDARTPVPQWITANPVIHCEDELLDSADAARVLGITGNGVRDLRRRGRLSATKASGRWLFRRRDLDEFAASRTR